MVAGKKSITAMRSNCCRAELLQHESLLAGISFTYIVLIADRISMVRLGGQKELLR